MWQTTDLQSLFKGSENSLEQIWDWTCEHICEFDYFWYPFDTENCPIILNSSYEKVEIQGKEIVYSGPEDLGKYYFKSIQFCNTDINGSKGLKIDFILQV